MIKINKEWISNQFVIALAAILYSSFLFTCLFVLFYVFLNLNDFDSFLISFISCCCLLILFFWHCFKSGYLNFDRVIPIRGFQLQIMIAFPVIILLVILLILNLISDFQVFDTLVDIMLVLTVEVFMIWIMIEKNKNHKIDRKR